MWGGLLSREIHKTVEAETVGCVEGNMCGAVMRGTDALPWSKTPSRTEGTGRNLGDLVPDRAMNVSLRPAAERRGAVNVDERAREVGQVRSTEEVREQGRPVAAAAEGMEGRRLVKGRAARGAAPQALDWSTVRKLEPLARPCAGHV